MKILLNKLTIICLLLASMGLLLTCSKMGWDDNPTTKRTRSNKTRRGKKKEETVDKELFKECKEDNFVIYSPEECERLQKAGVLTSPSSAMAQSGLVDIMFILDTDDPMDFYFDEGIFQKRFKDFISIIDQNFKNWQWFYTHADDDDEDTIGVALSLESETKILDSHVLTPKTPDYEEVFMYSITETPARGPGTTRCQYPPYCQDDPSPLAALKVAFSKNKHLTRAEADLVAVIITNSDEAPEEENKGTRATEVLKEFRDVYGSTKKLYVFNIIILPDDRECWKENDNNLGFFAQLWNNVYEGKKVASLVQKTGGGNFSICLDDYSKVARSIVQLVKGPGAFRASSMSPSSTLTPPAQPLSSPFSPTTEPSNP